MNQVYLEMVYGLPDTKPWGNLWIRGNIVTINLQHFFSLMLVRVSWLLW